MLNADFFDFAQHRESRQVFIMDKWIKSLTFVNVLPSKETWAKFVRLSQQSNLWQSMLAFGILYGGVEVAHQIVGKRLFVSYQRVLKQVDFAEAL